MVMLNFVLNKHEFVLLKSLFIFSLENISWPKLFCLMASLNMVSV